MIRARRKVLGLTQKLVCAQIRTEEGRAIGQGRATYESRLSSTKGFAESHRRSRTRCVLIPASYSRLWAGRETICSIDFSRGVGEWKSARRRALRIAKVKARWHDLRHTLVSRLAENPCSQRGDDSCTCGPRLARDACSIQPYSYRCEARSDLALGARGEESG